MFQSWIKHRKTRSYYPWKFCKSWWALESLTMLTGKKNIKKKKIRLISSMSGSQEICLTKQTLHPNSVFLVMRHQITQKQRKWVAMLSQILLITTLRNFQSLLSFTFLIYHFRSKYREKPPLVLGSTRGKTHSPSFHSIFATLQTQKDSTCCRWKNWQHSKKEELFKECYLGPNSYILPLRFTIYF